MLRARATELERDFAYGCVRRLLEPAVLGREDLFEGAAAMCHRLFEPDSIPRSPQDAESAATMLHGLYWLVSNLSDVAPVALAVDDLQWADTESLHFLKYLAPRLDGMPVAVVGGTRSGEGAPAGSRAALAAPETTVLRLAPLSDEATAVLCERGSACRRGSRVRAACREASGGNPFFLEELLREAGDRGSATDAGARRASAHRTPRRGPGGAAAPGGGPGSATGVVRAVAVLGDGARSPRPPSWPSLAADEVAVAAADLLVAIEVLDGGGRVRPPDRPRSRVRGHRAAPALAGTRARAALLAATRGAPEERSRRRPPPPSLSGDPERVVLLRRVAADALARGAPAAAVAWLRRALAEPPPLEARVEVLLELGGAELRVGAPDAIEHLGEAVGLIRDPRSS